MDGTARERGLTANTNLGPWTSDAETRYLQARDLVSAVITAYSARIAGASTPEEGEHLAAALREHVAVRRQLSVLDQPGVADVLHRYGALAQRARDEAG